MSRRARASRKAKANVPDRCETRRLDEDAMKKGLEERYPMVLLVSTDTVFMADDGKKTPSPITAAAASRVRVLYVYPLTMKPA